MCFCFCVCSHGCGVLVAIALFDMHECGDKRRVKRFKGVGVGVGGGRPPKPVPKAISGLKQSSDDETKVDVKRFKGVSVKSVALKQREFCIADQPRSPFRFFMYGIGFAFRFDIDFVIELLMYKCRQFITFCLILGIDNVDVLVMFLVLLVSNDVC